jgi:hypothetical protein
MNGGEIKMNNVLLQVLTNVEGQIIPENLKSIIPDNMSAPQALQHAMDILARTKLDDSFIKRYFSQFSLDILLEYNKVSETIMWENLDYVVSEILNDMVLNDDDEIFQLIFEQDFSSQFFESILRALFVFMMNTKLDEEPLDLFSANINAISEKVSKTFLLSNVKDDQFMLLTAALKRDDVSVEDLVENIDSISLEEIITWITEFQDNDRDEDSIFNTSNWNMLIHTLTAKSVNLV